MRQWLDTRHVPQTQNGCVLLLSLCALISQQFVESRVARSEMGDRMHTRLSRVNTHDGRLTTMTTAGNKSVYNYANGHTQHGHTQNETNNLDSDCGLPITWYTHKQQMHTHTTLFAIIIGLRFFLVSCVVRFWQQFTPIWGMVAFGRSPFNSPIQIQYSLISTQNSLFF